MADTPQISLTPDVTTVIVEPGRHFSIVCESGGDFRGEVEWSRLIGSGTQKSRLKSGLILILVIHP